MNEAVDGAVVAPQNPARAAEPQASISSERALGSFENSRYVETLLALDQRTQYAAEHIDLMVLRGYAYLNLRRFGDAQRVFEAAASTGRLMPFAGLPR